MANDNLSQVSRREQVLQRTADQAQNKTAKTKQDKETNYSQQYPHQNLGRYLHPVKTDPTASVKAQAAIRRNKPK
jgi:hypothetical protein